MNLTNTPLEMKLFVVLLALFMTVYCQEDGGYEETGESGGEEDGGWEGEKDGGWEGEEDGGWEGEDGGWEEDEYMSGCSSYSVTAAVFIVAVLGEFFWFISNIRVNA